jgi:tRNA U34 2-thiouridine synthase MnmA/TrmU
MEFESGFIYICHHIQTNEDWYVLGVDPERNKLCVAGHPATIANISDCENFEKLKPITEQELDYRKKTFGNSWL